MHVAEHSGTGGWRLYKLYRSCSQIAVFTFGYNKHKVSLEQDEKAVVTYVYNFGTLLRELALSQLVLNEIKANQDL